MSAFHIRYQCCGHCDEDGWGCPVGGHYIACIDDPRCDPGSKAVGTK